MKTLSLIILVLFAGSELVSAADLGAFPGTDQYKWDVGSVSCPGNAPSCAGAVAACTTKTKAWASAIKDAHAKAGKTIGDAQTAGVLTVGSLGGTNTGAAASAEGGAGNIGSVAKGTARTQAGAAGDLGGQATRCAQDLEKDCPAPMAGWQNIHDQCKDLAGKSNAYAAGKGKDAAAGGDMGQMAQGLMGALGALAPLAAQMMQKKNNDGSQNQKPTEYAQTSTSLGGGVSGTNTGAAAALGAPKPDETSLAVKDFSNPGYGSALTKDPAKSDYANTGNASMASAAAPSASEGGGSTGFGSSGASMAGVDKAGAGAGEKKADLLSNFDLPSLGGGTGRFLGLKGGSGASASPLDEEKKPDGMGGDVASADDPFAAERELASAEGGDPASEGGSLFKVVGLKIKEMKRRGNI